jgi:RNA polymerase sigma-70 factor (ECF subfamily)
MILTFRLCGSDATPRKQSTMPANGPWPTTQTNLLFQIRELENRVAWRSIVDIYGPLIFEFCTRRGLQGVDAEDVTQEVFQKVARGIRSFEYAKERGKFRGWLGMIARQEIGRFLAKKNAADKSANVATPLDSFSGDLESEWNDQFNGHILQSALERAKREFDSETWRAFEATWIDQMPTRDVSAQMKQTAPWIYKAKHKVLKRLKAIVDDILLDNLEL